MIVDVSRRYSWAVVGESRSAVASSHRSSSSIRVAVDEDTLPAATSATSEAS